MRSSGFVHTGSQRPAAPGSATPRLAGLAAVALGAACLAAIPLLQVALDLPRSFAWGAALASCGSVGLAFGLLWPRPSWCWGVLAAGAFWLFFGCVALVLWLRGEPEAAPALDAGLALAAGLAGGWLGGRISPRRAGADA
jgi:hypothetical protein